MMLVDWVLRGCMGLSLYDNANSNELMRYCDSDIIITSFNDSL